jgi:hypothetical protein
MKTFAMIWELFYTPIMAMAVLAAASVGLRLVTKLFQRQDRIDEEKRWNKYALEEHEEWIRLREQLVVEENMRMAAYPWNSRKIQLYSTCPSCGKETYWPYIGICTCGAKLNDPLS